MVNISAPSAILGRNFFLLLKASWWKSKDKDKKRERERERKAHLSYLLLFLMEWIFMPQIVKISMSNVIIDVRHLPQENYMVNEIFNESRQQHTT